MRIPVKANTEEWYKLRHECVTASDIGTFFDPNAFKTELSLYYEKLSPIPPSPRLADDPLYVRLEAGKALEPFIARMAHEKTGLIIQSDEAFYRHNDVDRYGATPDYIVRIPEGEVIDEMHGRDEELMAPLTAFDGPGVLEIKSDIFSPLNDEPPIKYLSQLQSQIDCMEFNWGVICTLVDLSYLNVCFYRKDPKAVEMIHKRVNAFWRKVDNRIQPDPSHKSEDLQIIRNLYPDIIEEEFDFSNNQQLFDACETYVDAYRGKKSHEKIVDTQKAMIAQLVQDAGRAKCGPFKIRRTAVTRKETLALHFADGSSAKYHYDSLKGELKEMADTMKRRGNKTKKKDGIKYEYEAGGTTISINITEAA